MSEELVLQGCADALILASTGLQAVVVLGRRLHIERLLRQTVGVGDRH